VALTAAPAQGAIKGPAPQPPIFWVGKKSQRETLRSGYLWLRVRAEADSRVVLSARIQKVGVKKRGPRIAHARVAVFEAGETRTIRLRLVGRGRKLLVGCGATYIKLRGRTRFGIFSGEKQPMQLDSTRCRNAPGAGGLPGGLTPGGPGEGQVEPGSGGLLSIPDPTPNDRHPPDPGGSKRPQRTMIGMHQDLLYHPPTIRVPAIQRAGELRAEVSRSALMWHNIEPNRGVQDWSVPDQVVNDLTARGVEPMFFFLGSPRWANQSPTDDQYQLWVPRPGPLYDQWVGQYAEFARQTARRYKGRVHRWEVWNEENHATLWRGAKPDPVQYKQLFVAVRNAIKSEDPEAQVAIGGPAGMSYSATGTYTGMEWIKGLHQAGLKLEYVSIHPYAHRNQAPDYHLPYENNFDDIQLAKDYLDSIGSKARLWVTEFGWDSEKIGEEQQADYMNRAFKLLRRDYHYVDMALVFVDRDLPPKYSQGLMRPDFSLKPAAITFREFVAALPR
jgi:hypothetical protein